MKENKVFAVISYDGYLGCNFTRYANGAATGCRDFPDGEITLATLDRIRDAIAEHLGLIEGSGHYKESVDG
jgi:hypothetical protein